MRRTIASIAAALTIASAAIVAPLPAADADAAPSTTRISGSDRWQTSVQLTRERTATGDVVFLASGTGFADALSAAPLVSWVDGQLLLSAPDALPTVVRDRLVELAPSEVVLVGGSAALSDGLLAEVQRLLPTAVVDRLAGANRVETSLVVADLLLELSGSDRAWVASGGQFADALAAAAVAGRDGSPIVLDVHGSDAASTQAWRDSVAPVLGGREVLVAGGPAAVPQTDVDWIGTLAGSTATRLSGANRYATAIEIADATWPQDWASTVLVASGAAFPDALGAAVLSAASGRPLLLAPPSCDDGVASAIESRILGPYGVYAAIGVGGRSALSDASLALTACPLPPAPLSPTHQALANQFGTFEPYEVSGFGGGSIAVPSNVDGIVVTIAVTSGRSASQAWVSAPSSDGRPVVLAGGSGMSASGFLQQSSLPQRVSSVQVSAYEAGWTARISDVRSLPMIGATASGEASAVFVWGGGTSAYDFTVTAPGFGRVLDVARDPWGSWRPNLSSGVAGNVLRTGPSVVIVEVNGPWQLRFR
ncbi:cell wall-binding repeat-containing protein [Agrococcus jejuensis]|uniref:cell wall-binding repeat-containing protein n=1 Tax=Agrococcus jejuensis TaxID=399736 RepID=UPI001643002E|nr:cell wall-binding repeat-containing protein [Agrococcus jejuensis]